MASLKSMRLKGFHVFRIPIPFAVGSINVYFIEAPCPTLIDVPPNGIFYRNHLEDALANVGYRVQDIRRIVVTHPHFDHFGLAKWIAEQSNADIWIHKDAANYLETYPGELTLDFRYYKRFLRLAAAPGKYNTYLGAFYKRAKTLGCQVNSPRCLEDGDEVELSSLKFRIMSVPGHTPYCILVYHPENRFAFTGDFLINEITSNAVLQRPKRGAGKFKSLVQYVSSLEKVREMDLGFALTGHGEMIDNPAARINRILAFINSRQGEIIALLQSGPHSVFNLMEKMFPNLPPTEIFLGLSEVMGHLELLEYRGRAARTNAGKQLSFFLL
jgi:glyoxylase-like metal-dependent hydrolase (beta-lactamase superfamily II)